MQRDSRAVPAKCHQNRLAGDCRAGWTFPSCLCFSFRAEELSVFPSNDSAFLRSAFCTNKPQPEPRTQPFSVCGLPPRL